MPIIQAKKDLQVFVDEDHSLTNVSEDYIGRKAYSLFNLREIDVPVPGFIALSASVFSQFVTNSVKTDPKDKPSVKKIAKQIETGQFPEEIEEEIFAGYARLSGFTEAWVAVRSSIVLPMSHRHHSFAGMLGTVLNVKGMDDLKAAIKKVYASVFTEKVANYAVSKGLSLADIKVGIVIQKMVQSECAGVVYTVDPISQDSNSLTVESVFGLGDVISNGQITPDQYVIDKDTLAYREKRVLPQEWMMVRKIKHKSGDSGEQKVKISQGWKHQQKLDDKYVKELSKLAILIEKKLGDPQDLEWVYEGGKIWILQTRESKPVQPRMIEPEKPIKIDENIIEAAQKIAEREKAREAVKEQIQNKQKAVQKESPVVHATMQKHDPEIKPVPGEKLLITGVGASQGSFRGEAVSVFNAEDVKRQKDRIHKDAVLVIPEFIPELEKYISKAGAVISDAGGMTSDVAITCRESGIPCIMGSHIASRMIKNGEQLLVDGTIGAVYALREDSKEQPSKPKLEEMAEDMPAPAKKEIRKEYKKLQLEQPESPESPKKIESKSESEPKQTKEKGKSKIKEKQVPEIRTATKVFLNLSDTYLRGDKWMENVDYADGVQIFDVEDVYKEINRHPKAYIVDKKRKEIVNILTQKMTDICEKADGNPVVVNIGGMNISEYQKLTRGKSEEKHDDDDMTEETAGLQRLLSRGEELDVFFDSIKNIRNKEGYRNVSIAIEKPGTPANLIEFKKQMSAAGLRRSSTFNLYLTITTPSETMVMDDFANADIDGVIVNLEELAKHMVAPKITDESVVKVVKQAKESLKDAKMTVVIPNSDSGLIKDLVKFGIYGISVKHSQIAQVRKDISNIEKELLLKSA